jgi:hypothetical protein
VAQGNVELSGLRRGLRLGGCRSGLAVEADDARKAVAEGLQATIVEPMARAETANFKVLLLMSSTPL